MSPVTLHIQAFGENVVKRQLLRFAGDLEHPRQALEAAATIMREATEAQFDTEGGHASGGWPPLSAGRVKYKADHGLAPEILRATDRLKESLTRKFDPDHIELIEDLSGGRLTFGTRVSYGIYHASTAPRAPHPLPAPSGADRRGQAADGQGNAAVPHRSSAGARMSDTNRFGRIITDGMVERAVVAALQYWLDDQLGEIERLEGYPAGAIERPHAIVTSSEFERMPEVQIPSILVINAGPMGNPMRCADGRYDARFIVGVAPIVSDVDYDATRALAKAYGAAVRTAIGQHKMLRSPLHPDGFANGSRWLGGDTDMDIPFADSRSLKAYRVMFQIGVDGVFTEQAGPRTPTMDPAVDPGPWPSATEVEANPRLVPLTGSLA